MPSASSKSVSMASLMPSLEGQDPLKVVVSMMEKKVRNLEKRKTRLISITQQVQEGKEIDKDQQDAVKKVEFVDNSLELAKEFHQIFRLMEQEHNKMQRKEQKRAKIELKEKSSEEQRTIVTQVLEVQSFLESMSDEVKEDFRKEANGAIKLTEEELALLDGIYKLITPDQNEDTENVKDQVRTAADHLHNLLDEKDKPVLTSTYKDIYGIITKVRSCKYFESAEKEEEEAAVGDAAVVETDAGTASSEDADDNSTPEESAVAADEEEEEATKPIIEDEAAASDATNEPKTTESTESVEHPMPPLVNGVDLPVEFQEAQDDAALNFMGESEVQPPVLPTEAEGKLNAASPEFIPRNLQSADEPSGGWEETPAAAVVLENAPTDNYEWHDVPSSADNQQAYRGRNGPRGRGDRGGFRGGRGGRGRGSYGGGQNGSNYHRQDKPDNYQRRDGTRGGPRGGNPRGGRGGPRGAPRGAAPRGAGFNRGQSQPPPQQQ